MKPNTILAAVAGLGFVAASPIFNWRSPNAHLIDPKVKETWNETCLKAGCHPDSSIYTDHTELSKPGGAAPSYLNVQREPKAAAGESHLRVFADGHTEHGWPDEDLPGILMGQQEVYEEKQQQRQASAQHETRQPRQPNRVRFSGAKA